MSARRRRAPARAAIAADPVVPGARRRRDSRRRRAGRGGRRAAACRRTRARPTCGRRRRWCRGCRGSSRRDRSPRDVGEPRVERLERAQRHELGDPGVADLEDVGHRAADERGQQLLVRRAPRDLLHAHAHAGVAALELRHQLRARPRPRGPSPRARSVPGAALARGRSSPPAGRAAAPSAPHATAAGAACRRAGPSAPRAVSVLERPDALVQRVDGVGIEQEHAALARRVSARGPSASARVDERARAPRAPRRASGAAPREQRAVERVHVRVDDGAHEAVALGVRQRRVRGARRGARSASQVAQLRRRIGLLRDEEEAPARACTSPRRDAARQHRERDREDERADDRRHPPEVVGVQPVERRRPRRWRTSVSSAVVAERLAPAGLGVLARPASASRPCARAGSCSTKRLWNTMRIGASRLDEHDLEHTLERSAGRRRRSARACAAAATISSDARASSAGRGSCRSPPAATSAQSGRQTGHSGNRLGPCGK